MKKNNTRKKTNSPNEVNSKRSRLSTPANIECRPYRRTPLFPLYTTTGWIGSMIDNKSASNKSEDEDVRNMIVVYFGKPIDVTSEYDGKRRTLIRRHLPFYQTKASSKTNTNLSWLKETWFPCLGLGKIGKKEHIFKLSGLKSYQGAIGKWHQFLDQQKRLHNKMSKRTNMPPLYTMDALSLKNKDGTLVDEDTFFKEVAARCPMWELLRISAGIGDGFWKEVPLFRDFVLTDSYTNRTYKKDEQFFLDHVRKTKMMLTSQVYEDRDDEYSLDLLRCRLSDIPELVVVVEDGKDTELVEF